MSVIKPDALPARPYFSSGPCAKPPGWAPEKLATAALGRSHRSKLGKARLKLAIDKTRAVLKIPADYRIGIMPGSDTKITLHISDRPWLTCLDRRNFNQTRSGPHPSFRSSQSRLQTPENLI